MMKKIAITGIMGAGKSSCSNLIVDLGYDVVDCDQLSHQLIQQGHQAYQQVVSAFSTQILDEQGEINRSSLATCIFEDIQKKQQLEAILHPLILQEIQDRARQCEKPLFFVEVPLLFESGMEQYFDEVICVSASLSIILERLQKGRGITLQQAQQRLNYQMNQEEKMKRSSFVIWNNHSLEEVRQQLIPWIVKKVEEENGTKSQRRLSL